MTSPAHPNLPPGGADLLTCGFAMTGSMWAVGYVSHLPGMNCPSWLVALGLGAVLLIGGFLTGRHTARGSLGGFVAGIITALLNLLVLGGILARSGSPDLSAYYWIPGTLLATALLCAIAASIGSMARRVNPQAQWTGRFALVAVLITGLLLIAGGLVTSREAGLAVPDWPSSYGYNMFLYPLARMTGNIYFEHAHRLYGTLVGLTAIILAIHIIRVDSRRGLRLLAIAAVILVCAQGILGGLRVVQSAPALADKAVDVATRQDETQLSAVLRVVHGVTAQIFLGMMAAIAVLCGRSWKATQPITVEAATDRPLSLMLLGVLVIQLILGAVARHLHAQVMTHMAFAGVVFLLAIACGLRAWGMHGQKLPALARCGQAVTALVTVQLALGIGALIAVGLNRPDGPPTIADVLLTTAHQANGAALLAFTVALVLLNHRLLIPRPLAA